MVATTTTATASRCRTTTPFFPLSLPKPPLSSKFNPLPKQNIYSIFPLISSSKQPHYSSSEIVSTRNLYSVSSPESSVVEEEAEEESGTPVSLDSGSVSSRLTGCKACGKEEIERGCNGEGRIQGGIATVPGFGWWPIKAYRPCPAYVATGGRYRRTGQSMDEVVSGSGRSTRDATSDGAKSSKKKEGPKKIKS